MERASRVRVTPKEVDADAADLPGGRRPCSKAQRHFCTNMKPEHGKGLCRLLLIMPRRQKSNQYRQQDRRQNELSRNSHRVHHRHDVIRP